MEPIAGGIGKKILVTGEVNTGKTTLCKRWLNEFCHQGLGPRIALIDMAPFIPHALALKRGIIGAGGELRPPSGSQVLDLRAQLEPPRLSSNSESEAIEKAGRNAQIIDTLINMLQPARDILFINDISLYLQSRSAASLIEAAEFGKRTTLIVNGYQGERLGGGELTRHEKAEMAELQRVFEDQGEVLRLTHRYDPSQTILNQA